MGSSLHRRSRLLHLIKPDENETVKKVFSLLRLLEEWKMFQPTVLSCVPGGERRRS